MTPMEALQQHQQLCDELHQLALDENRFLQQHQRAPGEALRERKRGLLGRLDTTLAALRAAPRGAGTPAFRAALEKVRARILQVLQLDRENEQLLLRYSLAAGRRPSSDHPDATGRPVAAPAPSLLQRIYSRHA